MEAEHRPDDEAIEIGIDTPGDPMPDSLDASGGQPIATLFRRRGFLSKDTGRWHKFTGGRDRHDERTGT